ncbi:hypothetical protein PHET_03892 [Paragonimus heterotremus]|uniref:Disks large-associated protein 1 n=1 Tax=Paragonimus heterotremus TaxID=100268 RepID=A0A8J4X0V5_9TREM|nr:hypothetical protein PHET_03892 [Paragonimus heterotremus]
MVEAHNCNTVLPTSRQHLLRSEVLAFFTPVSPHINSQFNFSSTPRTNIVEAVQPHTKTVTVECNMGLVQNHSYQGQPEGTDHIEKMDSGGCFRLDRLDSVVNPDATAKLDRMAKQLGFHVPTRVDTSMSQDDCGWDDLQMEDDSNANRGSVDQCLAKQSYHPKRSVFSTIMKRLSMPRTKGLHGSANANSGELTKIGTSENVDAVGQRNSSRPGRFRKWLHRRIWKSKGPLSKSPIRDQSVPSLASAEAILETNGFSSLHDEVSRPSCEDSGRLTDKPLRRAQIRNNLLDPEQARQCASLEELSDHTSYLPPSDGSCPPYSTVYQESIDDRSNFRGSPVDASQCSVIDDHLYTRMANNSATNSFCASPQPTTISFVPSCLVRDHSIRSVGDRVRGHVHFLYNSGNEEASSKATPVLSALSEAKLFQPTKPPSPFLSTHVPSYVGISVAAFGYSGYGRNSISSHSLPSSKNSVQPSSTSFSPSRGSPSGVRHPPDHFGMSTVADSTSCSTLHPRRLTIKGFANKPFIQRESVASDRPVAADSTDEPNTSSLGTTDALTNGLLTNRQDVTQPDSGSPCDSPSEIGDSSASGARLRRPRTRSHTATLDDQEHWQRSSLIMLAVAHASPRPRAVTLSVPETDTSKFFQPDLSVTDTSSAAVSPTAFNTVNHFDSNNRLPDTLEYPARPLPDSSEESPIVDGHYFLNKVNQTEADLTSLITQTESYIQTEVLDEETSGLLRTAIGKGRLLITEKFAQFRGLCQQNLDCEAARLRNIPINNQLDTRVSDLDGFWAMVTLQVDDVHALFDRIEAVRCNNWKPVIQGDSCLPVDSGAKLNGQRTKLRASSTKYVTASAGQRQRDDSKARLEARKRLEMVKREMRARKSTADVTGATQPGIEEESFVAV